MEEKEEYWVYKCSLCGIIIEKCRMENVKDTVKKELCEKCPKCGCSPDWKYIKM